MRTVGMTATILLLVGACTGGVGANTAQQAANGYRDAMIDRDFERAFAFMTREAQAAAVGSVLLAAAYASQADEKTLESFTRLAEQYAWVKNRTDLESYDDLPALFADVVGWVEENVPGGHGARIADAFVQQAKDAAFAEFEIDGDRAQAQMMTGKRKIRVRFEKIDGRWLMDKW